MGVRGDPNCPKGPTSTRRGLKVASGLLTPLSRTLTRGGRGTSTDGHTWKGPTAVGTATGNATLSGAPGTYNPVWGQADMAPLPFAGRTNSAVRCWWDPY